MNDTRPGESADNPLTHAPGKRSACDWAYKFCKCARCGVVAKCTRGFDFYVDEDLGPFHCEGCTVYRCTRGNREQAG